MNKKIATVGYCIPGYDKLELDFCSRSSLMDFDIICIAPNLPHYELSQIDQGWHAGKKSYGLNGSVKLREDIQHWKKELRSALKCGKTVFFLLLDKNEFYIDTGTRSYSGTGKNRHTTITVAKANNYELLPFEIGNIHSAEGEKVLSSGDPVFNNFYNLFKNDLFYNVYLENIKGRKIFTGSDNSKVLGVICENLGGHFIALPCINYDGDEFTESGNWTKEAKKFGANLVSCLIEINKSLVQNMSKTPAPAWINHQDYTSKKEIALIDAIEKNIEVIKGAEQENRRLESELNEECMLKDLLYEQGKPLEHAVIQALKILGYNAENYNDGELELDQVILSPEGFRYIGECEGKNEKDIDISKFRQLLESLNADFARENIDEKAFGILFGNAQRLIEPEKRNLDFTPKCKTGAKREKIALIKTTDLFLVAQYIRENNNEAFKLKCREAIHNGLGGIVQFPQIPI